MTYPKTINEVYLIEKDFIDCKIAPVDYILVTTQLKVDIYENEHSEIKNFEKKMRSSMKAVYKIVRSKKKQFPLLSEKYLVKPTTGIKQ